MTNYDIIKEACVKANPSILNLEFGCEVRGKNGFSEPFEGTYLSSITNDGKIHIRISKEISGKNPNKIHLISTFATGIDTLEILGRPIRLADVLLALRESLKDQTIEGGGTASLDVHMSGLFTGNFFDWEYDKVFFWNLREDDLSKQSEETLQFLADLLK